MKVFNALSISLMSLWCGIAGGAQPYDSIHSVPYEPYFLPNAWQVSNVLTSRGAASFIDVGSEGGAAARYIAQNTDGSIAIYSVDGWAAAGSFQHFLSNVVQENNHAKITPLRFSSQEAASGLNLLADVVYLNGFNNPNLADDILGWFPHLTANGVIVGDGWNLPATYLAVAQGAEALGLAVDVQGSFWMVRRP